MNVSKQSKCVINKHNLSIRGRNQAKLPFLNQESLRGIQVLGRWKYSKGKRKVGKRKVDKRKVGKKEGG